MAKIELQSIQFPGLPDTYYIPADIVRHSAQELTEEQKAQARQNIGITGTGKDGEDGYTPVKGTDYYTEEDKTEIVNAVIVALPVYNGEVEEV